MFFTAVTLLNIRLFAWSLHSNRNFRRLHLEKRQYLDCKDTKKMTLEQLNSVDLFLFSTSGECVILMLPSCQTHFVLREGNLRMLLKCNRIIHLASYVFHKALEMLHCSEEGTVGHAFYAPVLSNLLNYHREHIRRGIWRFPVSWVMKNMTVETLPWI